MILVKGGKVFPVAGAPIEDGAVLIGDDGKFAAVGPSGGIRAPEGARVIDASGKWVVPGLIDAHTHLSTLNEPVAGPHSPVTYDVNELSHPITPHVRAIDALNPHDMAIGLARAAGFTTCCTLPGSANVIGGTTIAFKTKECATVMEMAIPGTEQMKMAFGENPKNCYGVDKKMPVTRMGTAALLREALFTAQAYARKLEAAGGDPAKAPAPDFKSEALLPVLRGEMSCRIHCHRADDIVTAARVCKEFGLRFSIEHCTEGYKITDFLVENGITAVVGPLSVGPYKMEIWGLKLETPAVFEKAGVNFCLTEDDSSSMRFFLMFVGICVARGLSWARALEAVTVAPARLLGLSARVGSIEPGKDADLAVFSGDPFSNYSRCEATVIDGRVYEHVLS